MEVHHVCSLGTLCHTAEILKRNKIKQCSYPFDWIFSNHVTIAHCLEDNFNIFLDKSYYMDISPHKCGHYYYNHCMFNHHNPLYNKHHYNYFVRCVNRFKELLYFKGHKLFIMSFPNIDNFQPNLINEIIHFNIILSKYTENYTLLVILHFPNNANNYVFKNYNNIHFLYLYTLSHSNGIEFINKEDNDYLDNIINTTYCFVIENKDDNQSVVSFQLYDENENNKRRRYRKKKYNKKSTDIYMAKAEYASNKKTPSFFIQFFRYFTQCIS